MSYNQGCGTGKYEDGSGPDIFCENGSWYGSGSATLVLIQIKVPPPACKRLVAFHINFFNKPQADFLQAGKLVMFVMSHDMLTFF
jgi:hypothetical protein